MAAAVGTNRLKDVFEENELEDQGLFDFQRGFGKEIPFDGGIDNRLRGNKDEENDFIEVTYTYSKKVKRRKEENSDMTGNTNEDPTYEKLLGITNSLQENLLNENRSLKEYILYNTLGKEKKDATNQEIIDVCLSLYEKRMLTMNDVLSFSRMSIEEFMCELNKDNGFSFQYEDDFEVKEEDIEDWI